MEARQLQESTPECPQDLQKLNDEIAKINFEISDLQARRDALQYQKAQYHIHQAQNAEEGMKAPLSIAYRKYDDSPNGDFEWVQFFLNNASRSTVSRYIKHKSLPVHKIGNRLSFVKAEVEEWHSKHKKESSEERKNKVLKRLAR